MRASFARALLVGLAVGLGTLADVPAFAVPPAAPLASPRIHPEAGIVFSHLARTGRTFPSFRSNPVFEQTGEMPVVVRLRRAPSDQKLASLERQGVHLTRGNRPTASGAYLMRVTRAGLAALGEDPDMTRVSVDLPRRSMHPLRDSASETGARIARRAVLAKQGKTLDGTGTVIADIDTPVDLLHPAFFRADGGAYAWIDVDGDGALTIGTDGVDLDGSGTIEPAEILRALPSKATDYSGAEVAKHGAFTVDLDYLFLDTNGNGHRDAGRGFKETTPAYGEPIFVFDDANHDGILQASERVLRLGTSKFRIIRSGTTEYERGGGAGKHSLITYDPENSPRAGQTTHATEVDGVLVGGQPGISRWLGLAPGAELLLHETDGTDGGTVHAVQWAIDHGANVILTEYAQYAFVSLDGSSEDEAIVDAANDAGILTVSPTGNLGGTNKHRTVTVTPGTKTVLDIVPDSTFFTNATLGSLSLHYRGAARKLTTSVRLPSGTSYVIPENEEVGVAMDGGVRAVSAAALTPRGTHEQSIGLVEETPKFPKGNYALELEVDAGSPLELEVYAGDDVSVWEGGFAFTEETLSRTMCNPSTSDKTIAVGAYVLNDERGFYPAGKFGELATYSSRGPLLFGRGTAGVDLIAPDSPISVAPRGDVGEPLFTPASGTSGAGPHVAAAIALLRQAFPKESPSDLKKRLFDTARPEPTMSGGESASGHGKLDIAAGAGARVPDGTSPVVHLEVLEAPRMGAPGARLRVDATDDEAREALTARWDLDYDGTFDTDWLPLGEQVAPLKDRAEGASLGVKVEVRDGQGNSRAETVALTVLPASPPPAQSSDDTSGCNVVTREVSSTPRHGVGTALLAALGFLAMRRRRRAPGRNATTSLPTR